MKKLELSDILLKTDMKMPSELKRYISEIESVKTLLIFGATKELDYEDKRVLEPLKNLSLLQMDLDLMLKDIEDYEQNN